MSKQKKIVVRNARATAYDGTQYPSRRKALAAKRLARDENSPTLRQRGDNKRKDR